MNDEDLPIRAELASAYLDGELDAAARASAAADPEVMALVDSFTRVRAVLGEVQPIVDSTRTAAMAAALAEFDVLHAAATGNSPATGKVTPLQSRRMRAYRIVTGVAAAAVIGVVAVAAINSSGNDDNETSAIEASAPSETPDLKIDTSRVGDAAAGGAESADQAIESATVALPQVDGAKALSQYATANENLTLAAPTVQDDTAGSPYDAAPADTSAQSPVGLSSLPACITSGQSVIGGQIMYQGTPAYVVREASDGSVRAIDATDCRVLERVEAP